MASDDPFAQMGLANLYIGEKPPEENQSQQQPSYDVWGLTPTAAPPAPGTAAGAYAPAAAPVAAQAPAPVPPMNTPPPMQAPPMQQPPAVAANPYAQQAYPPQQQQQQPMMYQQPPLQAQQQQQYAPAYGAPAPAYAPAPAALPAPTLQAPASPAPAPVQPASPAAPAPGSFDPFAAAPAPAATAPAANPFGIITSTSSRDESPPPQRPANAPESQTFEVGDASPEKSSRKEVDVTGEEADFWAQMGFAVKETPANAVPQAGGKRMSLRASVVRTQPKGAKGGGGVAAAAEAAAKELSAVDESGAVDDQGLPIGGDYYDATLPGGYFGAVLKRAVDLNDSIFSTTPEAFTKAIGDRPVVAYTSQDSVVDKAGIAVGDVVLKVQNTEVNQPKTALSAIRRVCDQKCGYRGIELKCWSPPQSIDITLAENQCMVTYHGQQTNVPSTSWEWKSKYVVIGGVVANPWTINMYYTKRDYDVAVSETNAKQPKVSVKTKSYSLRGAKLLTPKPKTVSYSTQSQPWYFIMVQLTEKSRVVKIAHPLRDGLQPVLDGIERALKHYGRKKYGV